MDRFEFDRQLATAARALAEEPTTLSTLERAVQVATELIAGCDVAGISVVRDGQIDTPAASHEPLRRMDELQFELEEGPCRDALKEQEVVMVSDLAADQRWPHWGPRMVDEVGVRSSLSLRLFLEGDDLGALNLYGYEPDAFDQEDLLDGLVLAAHAAVALANTLEQDQLKRALDTRRVIGEATGMLRERFDLSTDQAFGVLKRVSSELNIKLFRVARYLVETGDLPEDDSAV
jgi:transcriptional regulator with GAF, ATPase, and Fis domain